MVERLRRRKARLMSGGMFWRCVRGVRRWTSVRVRAGMWCRGIKRSLWVKRAWRYGVSVLVRGMGVPVGGEY